MPVRWGAVDQHLHIAEALLEERALPKGGRLMLSPGNQAQIGFLFALSYGVAIVAVSLPIWWLLRRRGWDLWPAAAVLGGLATMAVWVADNSSVPEALPSLLYSGLPFSLCGALAGIATWRAGRAGIRVKQA